MCATCPSHLILLDLIALLLLTSEHNYETAHYVEFYLLGYNAV
jgi:hypothetical protein